MYEARPVVGINLCSPSPKCINSVNGREGKNEIDSPKSEGCQQGLNIAEVRLGEDVGLTEDELSRSSDGDRWTYAIVSNCVSGVNGY